MYQVDAGACRRARQADERPPRIARRVRRAGDVFGASGGEGGIASKREDVDFVETDQRANQLTGISANAGGGRCEAVSVETDTESSL